MNTKLAFLALVTSAFLSVPASALELINNDDTDYTIEVLIGEGDSSMQAFEVAAGETLSDICNEGCTIKLSNGAELNFVGDEVVSIRDGEFVIAE